MESSIEILSVNIILSVLISVAAEWLPGFNSWWHMLSSGKKSQLMALAVAIITIGLSGIRCYVYDDICPADWGTLVVQTLAAGFVSLAANQGVYSIAKNRKDF